MKGLGFDVVNQYDGQAWFLSAGKYHHHIGVNVWNGIGASQPPENSVGLDSFTLVFANKEVRQETINDLKNIGATVTEENNKFSTQDPSGNRIELSI